jgi:hypothetical protein
VYSVLESDVIPLTDLEDRSSATIELEKLLPIAQEVIRTKRTPAIVATVSPSSSPVKCLGNSDIPIGL